MLISLLLHCLFGPVALAAGEQDGASVSLWTTRDGLPQNSITDLKIAKDGAVWMTTSGGIARFDGLYFKSFGPANTPTLASARFQSLAVADDGTLWFSDEASNVYHHRQGQFYRHEAPGVVHELARGPDGTIWGASDGGLLRIQPDGIHVENPSAVRQLSILTDGTVVASGADHPFVCPSGCDGLPAPPTVKTPVGLSWFLDEDGSYWASGPAKVYQYTPDGWQVRLTTAIKGLSPGRIKTWHGALVVAAGGDLFDARTGQRLQLRDPLSQVSSNAPIFTVETDREGGLWLGTSGRGLIRVQPSEAWLSAEKNPVFSVAAGRNGSAWFGGCTFLWTLDADLVATRASPPETSKDACAAVSSDGLGNVLHAAGGAPGRWLVYRLAEGQVWEPVLDVPFQHEAHFSALTESPYLSDGHTVWQVPPSGDAVAIITARELSGEKIRPVARSGETGVWISVDDERLVQVLSTGVGRSIDTTAIATVRDVIERDDHLWLSSYGSGLVAVRGDTEVLRLDHRHGLCDSALSKVFDYGDGSWWINTNRGLCRVLESDLDDMLAGTVDAIPSRLVDSGEVNGTAGVQINGRLYAPTVAGLAVVDPRNLPEVSVPMLSISDVAYRGTAGQTQAVGPGGLAISYSAVEFRSPLSVEYRYRLRGSTDRWSTPTRAREVRFEELQPGHYTFDVQARGSSGVWSSTVTRSFHRLPAWWERTTVRLGLPIAAVLAGLLLLAVLLWWERRRVRALRREIDERRRAEALLGEQQAQTARVQAELENTRRLDALGRLAGGVAHDFNNLLMVMMSHAEFLQAHAEPEVAEDGAAILEAVQRGADLTRQLLAFGRQKTDSGELQAVGGAVESIAPLFHRLLPEDIQLRLDIRADPDVRLERSRLDQIISNLILNARDAITDRGHITITVEADADWAILTVQDTGVGMSQEEQERVFEPYYTTKALGSGLGLSTVHGAVLGAQGRIALTSALGKGTTVRVDLPRSHGTRSIPVVPVAMNRTTHHLLVVDDQPEVALAVGRVVEQLGWQVTTCTTLEAALQAMRLEPIDLALLDTIMPVHDGPTVAAALREIRPELPVLFMSGHVGHLAGRVPAELLLEKPFSADALVRAVAALD